MADRRDTQLAQVLSREPAQNLPINVVVAERGHILLEPEAAQPFDHIHGSCLETASLGNHYNLSAVFCPGFSVCPGGNPKGRDGRD